ncbi:MAG: tetratricopeptide repeat protein [Bacteroidales bacterium]|jgi:tetratricopeptide (TPR) repeat protein|nr:tetratricopeptide repeat protein [Bacteroidales bacterium]
MKRWIVLFSLWIITGALLGQKLNEACLQAKASLLLQQYAAAEQILLSTPETDRTPMMRFMLGESCYFSGKYSEAIRQFESIESGSLLPASQLYIAKSYAMTSQPAKAVEYLQKYLEQRDKLSESELELDPALSKIEHSKEWRTLWEKKWYNASEQKEAEVATLLKRKKYTEALTIIDNATKKNTAAEWWVLRAHAYIAMEQDAPALESFQNAIQARSNQPDYYAEAAVVAVRLQKYALALEYMQQVIRLDPYRLEAYLQRASILGLTKQYDDARADINFYFKYLPADDKALYQMGLTETEAGNPLSGIEYFSRLLEKDKSNTDYFTARAKAYIKTERYEEANDDFAQALDLNPRLPDVWLQKGIALHQVNDSEGACYCWQKAFNLSSKEAGGYIFKYCKK